MYMQDNNKTTFLRYLLKASTILSLIAILIQWAMYSKPYVTATYFHNTSILDMWNMFIVSSQKGTNHFAEMLTFLTLFEITVLVPPFIINKMPKFAIVLAIANILMVKTVQFFWDGVFPTTGLEATTGYYGFLIANIIIIIGACTTFKNRSQCEKSENTYCEANEVNEANKSKSTTTSAPTVQVTHKWCCDGCGNMITQSPCEHCGKE